MDQKVWLAGEPSLFLCEWQLVDKYFIILFSLLVHSDNLQLPFPITHSNPLN